MSEESTIPAADAPAADLRVVRPGKRLEWPADPRLFPVPTGDGAPSDRSHRIWLERHPEARERAIGTEREPYVVDLADPFEQAMCAGQGSRLQPIGEITWKGRRKPKEASPLGLEAAERLKAEMAEEEAARLEALSAAVSDPSPEGGDGSSEGGNASTGAGGGSGGAGGAFEAPEVPNRVFRPYPEGDARAEAWAGVYVDPGADDAVTHLLPAAPGSFPALLEEVAELTRPVPLDPGGAE